MIKETPLRTIDQEMPFPDMRIISPYGLMERAEADFSAELTAGYLTRPELLEFIKEKVIGIKVGGVDVVSVNIDHGSSEIDPILKLYIESHRTRIVVAEYFDPELRQNAENVPLFGSKVLNKYLEDTDKRIRFAQLVAEECKLAEKPVAVTDIANRMSYLLLRYAYRLGPTPLSLIGAFTIKDPEIAAVSYVMTILNFLNLNYVFEGRVKEKGMFDKKNIHDIEQYLIDLEDARRLIAARGVKLLVDQFPPLDALDEDEMTQYEKQHPQIILCYPEAHGRRILNHILQPTIPKQIKALAYRLLTPGLDMAVRTWKYKNQLQNLINSGFQWRTDNQPQNKTVLLADDLAGWRMISYQPIPLLNN